MGMVGGGGVEVGFMLQFMSFGLMSPSALCRRRLYVVQVYVADKFMPFGIMSHSV